MVDERASRIPGAVLWRAELPAGATLRVLPDGCQDLMWAAGSLMVAGPDTHAFVATAGAPSRDTGLRFAPGAGVRVLGIPAVELRDQRVPLAALWPAAEVRRLTDLVASAPDPGAALESVAIGRLAGTAPVDRSVAAITRLLAAGHGVAQTADALGWGERKLHRRCLDAFGYGPKMLARVLRMRRALALAGSGRPFASVANEAGYADQAHLAREVKALAGVPLGALLG